MSDQPSDPSSANEKTLPCRLCGRATRMFGTKVCDRCFELKEAIAAAPELARIVLDSIGPREPRGVMIKALRVIDEVAQTRRLRGEKVLMALVDKARYGTIDETWIEEADKALAGAKEPTT